VLYALLVYAFGAGVWLSAGRTLALRAAAVLIIGKAILGLIVTLFFPMHLRRMESSLTDRMHAVLTLIGVMCMLAAIAFAATAFGKPFRAYSVATIGSTRTSYVTWRKSLREALRAVSSRRWRRCGAA